MNRVLVVLGVVVALLLIVVGLVVVSTDLGTGVRVPARQETEEAAPPPDLVPVPAVQRKHRDRGGTRRRRDDPMPERPPFVGRVVGNITDAATALELADVRVTVFHPTGEPLGTALTDVHGNYDIDRLPDSVPLVLRLEHAGYLTGYCCDLETSLGRVATKDAAMRAGPVLTARVTTRPWNQPGADVRVVLLSGETIVGAATTDDQGEARIVATAYGEYDVRFESPGLATPPATKVVLSDDRAAELDVSMVEGGTVRVTVTTWSGAPSVGAEVTLGIRGVPPRKALTDARGAVEFEHVHAPSKATLHVVSPEGFRVANDVQVQDRYLASIGIRLMPFGAIRGHVSDKSGAPVADATVELRSESGKETHEVATDARGQFEHGGLGVGLWSIRVLASASNRPSVTDHVSVAHDGESTLEFVVDAIHPGIRGVVVDGDGQPVAGLRVRADPSGDVVTTGNDGSFSLMTSEAQELLTWQPYRLRAGDGSLRPHARPGQSVWTRYLAVVESPAGAETVADATPDERVQRWAETALRGCVMGPSGNAARAVLVTAGGRKAYTAADGSFELARAQYDADAGFLRVDFDPGPGLMLCTALLPDGVPDGVAELGTIHLRSRPLLRIRRPGPGRWSMLSTYPDRFVGGSGDGSGPIECRSYDGVWMHLPPAGAGRPPTRDLGLVLVARATPRGAWVGYDIWRPASQPVDVAKARWPSQWRIDVRVPSAAVGGQLEFVQTGPLLDRTAWELVERTEVDRLAKATFRVEIERTRGTVAGVAPGSYTVRMVSPKGESVLPILYLEGSATALDFTQKVKPTKKPKKR